MKGSRRYRILGTVGLLLMALCLGVVGCGPAKLTKADVVGTWVGDTTAGAQTIVLSANHRYTQVIDRDSEFRTREGTWTVADGAGGVVLRDAIVFDSNARTVPAWSTSDWSLLAKHSWRGMRFDAEGAFESGFLKSANPDRRPPR